MCAKSSFIHFSILCRFYILEGQGEKSFGWYPFPLLHLSAPKTRQECLNLTLFFLLLPCCLEVTESSAERFIQQWINQAGPRRQNQPWLFMPLSLLSSVCVLSSQGYGIIDIQESPVAPEGAVHLKQRQTIYLILFHLNIYL